MDEDLILEQGDNIGVPMGEVDLIGSQTAMREGRLIRREGGKQRKKILQGLK